MMKNDNNMKMTLLVNVVLVILPLVLLLGCNGSTEQNNASIETQSVILSDDDVWPKRVIVREYMRGKLDSIIEYSSMAEAEQKLLQYISPVPEDSDGFVAQNFWESFYDAFSTVLLSHASSMAYPFDSLCLYANIAKTESKDGKLRIYSWQPPHFYTMSDFHNLVQYEWNGKVRCQNTSALFCEEDMCSEPMMEILSENQSECGTIYLVAEYFREWSSMAYQNFCTYILSEDGLSRVPVFATNDHEYKDAIGFEYDIPDWFDRANYGEGYDWIQFYDTIGKTLYLADSESEYPYISDRYYKYKWDGRKFVCDGSTYANPFMHSSLCEYVCLMEQMETERNKIRIDMLADSTFRYTAWKLGAKMSDAPELVIYNGYRTKGDEYYVFNNDGYEYKVGDGDVVVTKGGMVVGRWKVVCNL